MVIVVGGTPIATQRARTSSRSQHGLPAIPAHGPAALLSSDILLSRVEEISWADNAPQGQRRRQQRLPVATTGLRPLHLPSSKSLGKQLSVAHTLHRTDTVDAPRFLDTLLAGFHSESEVSLIIERHSDDADIASSAECATIPPRTPLTTQVPTPFTSPSASSAGQVLTAVDCASRSKHSQETSPPRTPFTSQVLSPRGSPTTPAGQGMTAAECAIRNRHLQESFRHSLDDIRARLAELDQHANQGLTDHRTSAAGVAERLNARQALLNELYKESGEFKPSKDDPPSDGDEDEPEVSQLSDELHLAMPELLKAFDRSAIGFIAARPFTNIRVTKDEQGFMGTLASPEEVSMATEVLNFHRWLCMLPPVTLNKLCIRTCQVMNEALFPRSPVFLKPSSPQFTCMTRFAHFLADFVTPRSRSIILHGDASLADAIVQALLACHAPVVDPSPVLPARLRGLYPDEVIATVHRRAEQFRKTMPTENKRPLHPVAFFPQAEREVVGLQNMPSNLFNFRVFWELIEYERRPATSGSQAVSPQKTGDAQQLRQLPNQGRAKRAPKQPSRTRTLAWSPEQAKREAAKNAVFWGDREQKVLFRRILLNPSIESFGASRANDTCAMWTAGEKIRVARSRPQPIVRKESSLKQSKNASTPTPTPEVPASSCDVVCFPPPGFFPYEFLFGTVPTWTLMPSGHIYQPTQSLSVRMWRVRIEDGTAERLDEITVSSLFCDCSAKGNPFCVIFQPELQMVVEGDQFEVELRGLRGCETGHHFFHEFRCFQLDHYDFALLNVAQEFCSMLENPLLWKEPGKFVAGYDTEAPTKKASVRLRPMAPVSSRRTSSSRRASTATQDGSTRFQPPRSPTSMSLRGIRTPTNMSSVPLGQSGNVMPEIGLVSHQSQSFIAESVDQTISLFCAGAVVMRAQLNVVRASGREEVRRSTWVLKCGHYFVVKVKFPMSHSRYELVFKVSLPSAPDTLIEHPLKYFISASEAIQNLLISMDHPLKDKFGYAFQSPLAQVHGITVIAPQMYRVRAGFMYLLVHADAEAYIQCDLNDTESDAPKQSRLFSDRLFPEASYASTDTARSTRADSTLSLGAVLSQNVETVKCVVTAFQQILRPAMEPLIQDARHAIHLDVSVLRQSMDAGSPGGVALSQRYVKRLQRRPDLPEFYHGFLWFSDRDVDCIVELFLRFPRAQAEQYAPLKIGEWRIVRKDEDFPSGF